MVFFAAMMNAVTSTTYSTALRNSLICPPAKIKIPPAPTMPMIDTPYATGPVIEFDSVVRGASRGNPPPPVAACAVRGAHKTIPTNNHIDIIANILYFMYLYMFSSLCFLEQVIAVLGSWSHVVSLCCAIKILHLKDLTHDAAFTCACDMDDDIHGFPDQAFDHPAWSVRVHRH